MFRFIKTRIYPLSAPAGQPPRWPGLVKAVAACALTAGALHTPAALAAHTCSVGNMAFTGGGWNVLRDFSSIRDGVTVASVDVSNYVTASGVGAGYSLFVAIQNTSARELIPLVNFPGMAMRWTFVGYANASAAALNPNGFPSSKILSNSAMLGSTSKFSESGSSKAFWLKWKLEMVVTDVRVYAGGTGSFVGEPNLAQNNLYALPYISDAAGANLQSCSGVTASFGQALGGGSITLPELPKPPTPTCQFPISSMNQSIPLVLSTNGRVPASGSARTAGATDETRFNIQANNCGADSHYAIYFTDANASGVSKDYLTSTGALAGKVNLRMYQGANSTAVPYGPAPTGSGVPDGRAPGVENMYTPAGSYYLHDFYVQYVRAPGFVGTIPAGALSAQTTATVVYP